MAKNFHLWEVDPFFSAAEEVQDSADGLESVYRSWIHAKSTNDMNSPLYGQKLGTALGTSKWQLEEFERAVSLVENGSDDCYDEASARHKQFIDAIRCQITCIERDLLNSEDCRGLKKLPMVNLGHEDRDELALFLCGSMDHVYNHCRGSYLSEGNSQSPSLGSVGYDNQVPNWFAATENGVPDKHDYTKADEDQVFDVGNCSKSEDELLEIIVDHGGRAVSGSAPEHSLADDSDGRGNSTMKQSGWLQSANVGSSLNLWQTGSVTQNDVKKQQSGGPRSWKSFWGYLKRKHQTWEQGLSKSMLKRWKDGDGDGHELSALLTQAQFEKAEISMENGHMTCSTEHWQMGNGGPLAIRLQCAVFSSAQPVQIASAILVALGFIGILSFGVTVASF